MYSFKTMNQSDFELLKKNKSLDKIDHECTLEELINSGLYTELSPNLMNLIEENIDNKSIAVIKDLDKTAITKYKKNIVEDTYLLEKNKSTSINEISNVVINGTDNLSSLKETGLAPKKIKNIQVYWGLNDNTVKRIITPIEQDVIYSICQGKEPSLNELHFLLNKIVSNLEMPEFDGLEAFVYDQLYVQGKSFIDLVAYVLRQNRAYEGIANKNEYDHYDIEDYESYYTIYNEKSQIEALDVYNYLCDIKRDIIEKIVELNVSKYNMHFPMTTIPEDGMIVSRIGCEKPDKEQDIYISDEHVHLVPYEYEEVKTHKRNKCGLNVSYARSNSINYSR